MRIATACEIDRDGEGGDVGDLAELALLVDPLRQCHRIRVATRAVPGSGRYARVSAVPMAGSAVASGYDMNSGR